MPHDIVILAFPNCLGSSVLGPADLFSTCNAIRRQVGKRGRAIRTRIATPDGGPVRASNGHVIHADCGTGQIARADVVMIPGIGVESARDIEKTVAELRPLAPWLRTRHAMGSLVTASCTGTFLLAESGLLESRRATTTWWLEDAFRSRYPNVDLRTECILVDDTDLVTSAAGASYFDLALHLIERIDGPSIARLCAKFMVIDSGRASQRPYTTPWHVIRRDPLIERADDWIKDRLADKISVETMAKYLGVSSRTLVRRFRERCGMTPQAFVQRARIERAKQILETSKMPLSRLIGEVGYANENAFRRMFIGHTGMSPTLYRRQFRSYVS